MAYAGLPDRARDFSERIPVQLISMAHSFPKESSDEIAG